MLEALDVDAKAGALKKLPESVLSRGEVAWVLAGDAPFELMDGGAREEAEVADILE